MKTLALTSFAVLAAAPAFAHGGAHLHPHGIDTMVAATALLAAVAMGAAGAYWRSGRK